MPTTRMPGVRPAALVAVLFVSLLLPAGASAPQAGYPIVQVRKWQFDFMITASERVSTKIADGKAEMFHQPNWHISGSALLEMDRDEDGNIRTASPRATGNSWGGRTTTTYAYRGESGVIPSATKITSGYAGTGSLTPADEQGNRVIFQLSAERKTYDISLWLQMKGQEFSDASELFAEIDRQAAAAKPKDAIEAALVKWGAETAKAMAAGGAGKPARSSAPFKLSINPGIEGLRLPEAGGGSIPTISGSQKVKASFAPGPMEPDIVFTWTIKPYDDSNDVDVEVRNLKTSHPHCACGENTLVELTAVASKPGGTFEPFEVTTSGNGPRLMKNQGGGRPYLSLQGYDRTVGQVIVTAVHTYKGRQFRSRPFEVNFCHVAKPEIVDNAFLYDGKYHVFSQSTPGELEIEAKTKVWYNGQEVKENTEDWDIQPETIQFSRDYAGGEVRVTFKASGLPEKNSAFGKCAITYTYDDGACRCSSEAAEAQIFYPRDEKNNPGGQMANWAYYWRQTKAGIDGVGFEVVRKIPGSDVAIALPILSCLGPILAQPGDNVIARYDPMKDKIYISDALPTLSCANRPSGAVEDKGIDCFAVTLRHERQHQVELTAWWGPKFSNYSCLQDIDGDMVPNDVEKANPGCNPLLPWSCPSRPTYLQGTVFDVDLTAYQVGWRWVPHSADKEDWAYPGHQCGGR